jgi:Gram-negative porin
MRKILLGSTAVIGAALLAPTGAFAQDGGGRPAPAVVNPATPDYGSYGRTGGPGLSPGDIQVRIGGYFAAWYSHTIQSNPNTFNSGQPVGAGISNGAAAPPTGSVTGSGPGGLSNAGSVANGQTGFTANQSTKTGKNDFSSDAEIHVYVDGKTANGIRYGAVIEMSFNGSEGTVATSGRRSYSLKTGAFIDEMYAYAAAPGLGQIRFGDEDGAVGLMTTGVITSFGTGGVYGSWQNNVIRPNRTTTSPGDLGDNTKIIYLSPQFYGFDFGGSFAFNSNTGANNGCIASFAVYSCDRTYAFTGATTNAVQPYSDFPQRLNEHQAVIRYRGEFAGVGVAASFGHVGWQAMRDLTVAGATANTLRPGSVWMAGLQASAYGLTVGALYQWGQANYFWGSQLRGDQSMNQWTVGGSYTVGPFTIGANGFWGTYAGSNGFAFNTVTGAYTRVAGGAANSQKRWAYAAGANYRLAPGLDLVAEYVHQEIHEAGNTGLVAGTQNLQDRLKADVIIVGTRLAF